MLDPATERELAPRAARATPLAGVRNVVILILESIRYDPDSTFVRGFPEALHFDRFYAHHPRSVKTLEALLFGIYPSPWRATAAWAIDHYDLGEIGALPALLGNAGFASSYFGSTNLMFDGYGATLHGAGFDHVERVTSGVELTWGFDADSTFGRVAETVEKGRAAGVPQLVVAWTTECHRPFDFSGSAISATDGRELADRYRACSEALAGAAQRLIARLERSGAVGDTLLVMVGDHGQTFGAERAGELPYGQHVFEPSVHVPMLLLPPAGERPARSGARDRRLFQIVDLPLTIVSALGLRPPPDWVGRNMLDPEEAGRERAFVLSVLDPETLGAVDSTGRKEVQARDGRLLAYDVVSDPEESAPEVVEGEAARRARARLATYIAVAARGWTSRERVAADGGTYTGRDLLRFARAGTCLDVSFDEPSGALLVAPRAQPECTSRVSRRHRFVRRLAADELRADSGLRLSLRIRLDREPTAEEAPVRAQARLGGTGAFVEADLAPVAGEWQEVSLSLAPPAPDARDPSALEVVPSDVALPYAIESFSLTSQGAATGAAAAP